MRYIEPLHSAARPILGSPGGTVRLVRSNDTEQGDEFRVQLTKDYKNYVTFGKFGLEQDNEARAVFTHVCRNKDQAWELIEDILEGDPDGLDKWQDFVDQAVLDYEAGVQTIQVTLDLTWTGVENINQIKDALREKLTSMAKVRVNSIRFPQHEQSLAGGRLSG